MKKVYCLLAITFLVITVGTSGCLDLQREKDVLFQTSTINALVKGIYDGDITFKDLKRHGDFGIGTFNSLDGEMVALAGEFYQIKADGRAYPVDDSMKTPFSIVTFFEPDKAFLLDKALNHEQLQQYLDNLLPTKNIFYAIKIEGIFKYIKTRSVPKQNKPYPPLVEVVKNQPTFEFHEVVGTIVGFRCPTYVEGINVPGYHFHFISGDRKAGGHLLECQMQSVKIEIDYTSEFYMVLPESEEFYKVDLVEEKSTELKKVEKGLTGDYRSAFRLAVQAHFADPIHFHDLHGLMTLGLLRQELVSEFGREQVNCWLDHAIAEACLVKTGEGWAGAHVLQPDLPAVPSRGAEPSIHFTAELILAMAWNNLEEFRRPGWEEELVIPRADLVRWLQRYIALDKLSPGMETQALIVAGVSPTETWQAADGETWSVEKLLELVIIRWRENREEASLKPGSVVPENMLHLAPALVDLVRLYPETIVTYRPILDEVFTTYENALHPDGYWGFPGEAWSTGHIVEQYVSAQKAGLDVTLPSLRPIELMVEHQATDGWFDIHNAPYIGAQAHGVRALGVTLPLLEAQTAKSGR